MAQISLKLPQPADVIQPNHIPFTTLLHLVKPHLLSLLHENPNEGTTELYQQQQELGMERRFRNRIRQWAFWFCIYVSMIKALVCF